MNTSSCKHLARLAKRLIWRSPAVLVEQPILMSLVRRHLNSCLQTRSRGIATGQICLSINNQSTDDREQEESSTGPSEEAKRRARNFQLATGAACAFFGASYILYRQLKVNAAEATKEMVVHVEGENDSQEQEQEGDTKKKRSVHDRHVIAYEDRIRAYSTPDKIFRYFATLSIRQEDGSSQTYMTPDDFLRSITPGKIQPDGLGLDQFMKMTAEQWKVRYSKKKIDQNSVFARLGHNGLISFTDYLFLLTLLATPYHHFAIAFKMFDLNGDGEVDVDEFERVRDVVLSTTSVGARHRDRTTTGNVAGTVDDALVEYFFGPNKDKRLTVETFEQFHKQLQIEFLSLEFKNHHPSPNGYISEYEFAKLILSYSSMNNQAKKKYLKRIKKKYGRPSSDCPNFENGINFDDLIAFSHLVQSITDVEMALGMYMAAGASITAGDLKSVSKAVAGVDLSDHLVEVVIALFDEDGDGDLSYGEFIKVVKSRTSRGLEKSKELGFSRLMGAMLGCSEKLAKDFIGMKS